MTAVIAAGIVFAAVLLIVVLFKAMWKVPRANEALIVTGWGIGKQEVDADRSYKVVTGSGAFVIPLLQRAQYLSLAPMQVSLDVVGYDKQKIPVGITGSVMFKVGDSEHEITNAAIRFLDDQNEGRGGTQSQMAHMVQEVVHGHLRSMIGGLSIEEIIGDRSALAQQARDASVADIEAMGLKFDSLQVQNLDDPANYIEALTATRMSEVKMNARIAQAARDREASEREAEARAMVAEANAEAAKREQASLAVQAKAQAEAAQAGPLAEAEARRAVVRQETEVATLEAEREQSRLEATVYKQSDANAYAARVQAEGEAAARVATAQAAATEQKLTGEAEAAIVELRGAAEAQAVKAKGLAEAAGIDARAKALEKEADAVVAQTIAEKMPEIVASASKAFGSIDNLTVLNGAEGLAQLMAQTVSQVGPVMAAARSALSNGGSNGHTTRLQDEERAEEEEALR